MGRWPITAHRPIADKTLSIINIMRWSLKIMSAGYTRQTQLFFIQPEEGSIYFARSAAGLNLTTLRAGIWIFSVV